MSSRLTNSSNSVPRFEPIRSNTSISCRYRSLSVATRGVRKRVEFGLDRSCNGGGLERINASRESSTETPSPSSQSPVERVTLFMNAFWKFLRPHTIRGTVLGSVSVTTRALIENPAAINWTLLPRALIGVLALLCGNGFIVGINQIYDVHIDKVNKPFLPVASKEMSMMSAWVMVAALAIAGVTLASHYFGLLIGSLYTFGLTLGTVYSAPPFRLKRFAIPAFLIIATVRGFLLNFGVYYATRAALKLRFKWSPAISFITVFVTLFAVSIAITKDLPDIKGDRRFKINTLATKLGVGRIAFLGSGLLLMNYIGACALACVMPHSFNPVTMIAGHAILSAKLILETMRLDQDKYQRKAIQRYYGWIWILFYFEYVLLPFI
eukprot:g5621.t1